MTIRSIRWAILTSIGLAALGVAPAVAYADHNESAENEHEVSLNSIPAPARDALLKRAAGATIIKTEEQTERGVTVYSVHVKNAQGGITEIMVDAKGNFVRQGPEEDKD